MDDCANALIAAVRVGFHLGNHCPPWTFEDYLVATLTSAPAEQTTNTLSTMSTLIAEAVHDAETEVFDEARRDELFLGAGVAMALSALAECKATESAGGVSQLVERTIRGLIRKSAQNRLDALNAT